MDGKQKLYLCGGVFFFLLTRATLPKGTPRDHRAGVKDDHSDPILMKDLVYAFTGNRNVNAGKDTSKYKDCLSEGSCNLPFNERDKCIAYDGLVRENYAEALARMNEFVNWHLDANMRVWFVKAVLDVIDKDESINDEKLFFINSDGCTIEKAKMLGEPSYDLPAFLVGVLHFILTDRRNKNHYGEETLALIGTKVPHRPRQYVGTLGEEISRKIEVSFLSPVSQPPVEKPDKDVVLEPDEIVTEKTDDEVIQEAFMRSGETVASVLSATTQGMKIDVQSLADSIAPFARAMDTLRPDPETMAASAAAIDAMYKANKHAIADQIRKANQQKESETNATPADDIGEAEEIPPQGETKTTVVLQNGQVIQNGTNNYNLTNTGNLTLNIGGGKL